MDKEHIKPIAEALLFINEKPIETNELAQLLEVAKKEMESALDELAQEYKGRGSGICIVKVAGGYQMCTSAENETWVKRMYRERGKQKLSTASLETLAIIAYKQPITRVEIEAIRGVSVDGVVRKLAELGLIKIGGRKDVVGKPFLYITTRKFLEFFGINSLKDLPNLEDFVSLAEKENRLLDEENNQESSESEDIEQGEDENPDQKDINNDQKIKEEEERIK